MAGKPKTPEQKEMFRQKALAARARETPEQKEARIKKFKETVGKNPDSWKERNKKISETRKTFSEYYGEVAKESLANIDDETRQKMLDNLELGGTIETAERGAKTRKYKQYEINSNISETLEKRNRSNNK